MVKGNINIEITLEKCWQHFELFIFVRFFKKFDVFGLGKTLLIVFVKNVIKIKNYSLSFEPRT